MFFFPAMYMDGQLILRKARGLLYQFRQLQKIPCTLSNLCRRCGPGMWDSGHHPAIECVGHTDDDHCILSGEWIQPRIFIASSCLRYIHKLYFNGLHFDLTCCQLCKCIFWFSMFYIYYLASLFKKKLKVLGNLLKCFFQNRIPTSFNGFDALITMLYFVKNLDFFFNLLKSNRKCLNFSYILYIFVTNQ